MVPVERAMVVSYRRSVHSAVTIVLSLLAIRPQFAIEYLKSIHFGSNFVGEVLTYVA